MKKLTADMAGKREQFAKELSELFSTVEEHYTKVDDAVTAYNLCVEEFNTKLSDVAEFIVEVTTEMENYADDKSDKWKEGDAGEAFEQWKSTWEEFDADPLELMELPSIQDTTASGAADALNALPSEPE